MECVFIVTKINKKKVNSLYLSIFLHLFIYLRNLSLRLIEASSSIYLSNLAGNEGQNSQRWRESYLFKSLLYLSISLSILAGSERLKRAGVTSEKERAIYLSIFLLIYLFIYFSWKWKAKGNGRWRAIYSSIYLSI